MHQSNHMPSTDLAVDAEIWGLKAMPQPGTWLTTANLILTSVHGEQTK